MCPPVLHPCPVFLIPESWWGCLGHFEAPGQWLALGAPPAPFKVPWILASFAGMRPTLGTLPKWVWTVKVSCTWYCMHVTPGLSGAWPPLSAVSPVFMKWQLCGSGEQNYEREETSVLRGEHQGERGMEVCRDGCPCPVVQCTLLGAQWVYMERKRTQKRIHAGTGHSVWSYH